MYIVSIGARWKDSPFVRDAFRSFVRSSGFAISSRTDDRGLFWTSVSSVREIADRSAVITGPRNRTTERQDDEELVGRRTAKAPMRKREYA